MACVIGCAAKRVCDAMYQYCVSYTVVLCSIYSARSLCNAIFVWLWWLLMLFLHTTYCRDYEKAYELETDETTLKDIKLKVKKVGTLIYRWIIVLSTVGVRMWTCCILLFCAYTIPILTLSVVCLHFMRMWFINQCNHVTTYIFTYIFTYLITL